MVIKIHFTVIQMHLLVIEMYCFSYPDALIGYRNIFYSYWNTLFSPSKYNLWEKPVSKLTGESAGTYKQIQKGFRE